MKLKNHITFVINRKIYKDIQRQSVKIFTLDATTSYWTTRLLSQITPNSELILHPITSITFRNGIRWNSPSFKIECKNIIYDVELNKFIFELGEIYK